MALVGSFSTVRGRAPRAGREALARSRANAVRTASGQAIARAVPGITLLGDAAHLMPPVGIGANLAMLDGTDLAHALITESSLGDAVRAYENLMLPRSAQAAQDRAEALDNLVPPKDF